MSFGFFKTISKTSPCPGMEERPPPFLSPLKSAISICSGTVLITPASSFSAGQVYFKF